MLGLRKRHFDENSRGSSPGDHISEFAEMGL